MNLQSIRIFLAIVREGSISGAARQLHFTQPTVSEYLNNLEKELGVQLFYRERGSRKVTLTQAGTDFLPLAHKWISLEEQVTEYKNAQQHKVFRLAASAAAHEYMVTHVVQKLMRRVPHTEIRLINMESREIYSAIDYKNFDAAFFFGKGPERARIIKTPLFSEKRVILCPADTPLPERTLFPQELDPSFEIVYASNLNHKGIIGWKAKYCTEPKTPYFVSSVLRIVYSYMTDPRCWALVPISVALQQVEHNPGRLTIRDVEPAPPQRDCILMSVKAYPDTEVIQRLLECCNEYIDERPYLEKKLILPENNGVSQ